MCRLISGSLSNPIPREGKTEIYIYKALRQSVCQSVPFCLSPGDKQFVCPPGNKHFSHTGEGGGANIFDTQGDKHF